MPNVLKPTLFGNPILREQATLLTKGSIQSEEVQNLLVDMWFTLETKKYGVGLAAPQIGVGVSLVVIGIKPTPSRPDLETVKMALFNPEIVATYGSRRKMWEGCISFGVGNNFPYAQCLRWQKIRVKYLDEAGRRCELDFDGILAHVLQHEIDHVNGILFVDRVRDPTSYMMVSEYKKRILPATSRLGRKPKSEG